mgnify:CR=1 FL=1
MTYEIVAQLSGAFNAKAADTRVILTKYNAQLNPMFSDYHSVTGVKDQDADSFLAEFRKLKGVEAAYKKPPATPSF